MFLAYHQQYSNTNQQSPTQCMVSSASRNLNQLTESFLRFLLRKTYCTINTDEHKEMKAVGFGTMAMAFCMEVKVDMVISK